MSAEYIWEEVYKAALVETDLGKLPTRVQAAEAAIDNRLHELQLDQGRAARRAARYERCARGAKHSSEGVTKHQHRPLR